MGFGNGYVVGWGTLALINAALAQGKGRSGGNWFLVSLLFGPLATLAIVVLERGDVTAPAKRPPMANSTKLLAVALVVMAIALAAFGLPH